MTLLKAIHLLEVACLTKDSKPTTKEELVQNGRDETRRYFDWLRQQAPGTAMFVPWWDKLTAKPRSWQPLA